MAAKALLPIENTVGTVAELASATGDFRALVALEIALSVEDITRLETTVPASAVAGTRCDSHQMRMLDSEK